MSNAGNAKTLAQHFTPAAVAQLTWDAVRTLAGKDLGAGARVVDPAAGEGALLAVVGRAYQTTGIEIDEELAERGRSQADCFYTGDGLLGTFPEVEDESFDCVLANPPFGKLGSMLPLFGADGPCRLARRFGLLDGLAALSRCRLQAKVETDARRSIAPAFIGVGCEAHPPAGPKIGIATLL